MDHSDASEAGGLPGLISHLGFDEIRRPERRDDRGDMEGAPCVRSDPDRTVHGQGVGLGARSGSRLHEELEPLGTVGRLGLDAPTRSAAQDRTTGQGESEDEDEEEASRRQGRQASDGLYDGRLASNAATSVFVRERHADVIETVEQPVLGERIDLEHCLETGSFDGLHLEIDADLRRWLVFGQLDEVVAFLLGQHHGQQADLRAVRIEDVGEGRGDRLPRIPNPGFPTGRVRATSPIRSWGR